MDIHDWLEGVRRLAARPPRRQPGGRRAGLRTSSALLALGGMVLLSAGFYAAYASLAAYLMEQDRYLVADTIAPLPLPGRQPAPGGPAAGVALAAVTPAAVVLPPTATPLPTAAPTHALGASATPAEGRARTSSQQEPTATPPVAAPPASHTLEPSATPAIASAAPPPEQEPTPEPVVAAPAAGSMPPPVQVRIPAVDVSRSVVPLPGTQDGSGAWTWDTDRLFRSGRSDLVGHWEASANPGEQGNMVLVGHNYGYGFNGVFVSLGRLEAGDEVTVVNSEGRTFEYRVVSVTHVKWRNQDFAELTQHLSFLAPGGSERLTLVSCAGADVEPFPERVYVVAEPRY